MPKKNNQKLRLLYIKDILEKHTDENHGISRAEFKTYLSHYNVEAPTRKTFYDDLKALEDYGMELDHDPYGKCYQLLERQFDLPEIKLIIDAIQSSKSIPESMTTTIIKKMESLCSKYQARELHRAVIVSGRVKTLNEGTRNNIDYIHAAISEDKQITFKYFDYDTSLKKKYRKRGAKYTISPYALVYSDENYYLLAYDKAYKAIRNYRVDRMEGVNIIGESIREGKEEFDAIDMRKFQKYTFGMYSGEVKEVTMVFTNNMMNAVVDRFGRDIFINKEDDYHFRVSVEVAVSPQFYGWVFGLGKMVKIIGPEDVRQGYLDMISGVQEKYE